MPLTPAETTNKTVNTITGRVVVKESGFGVPDLLVAMYDLDPNSSPEEELRAGRSTGGTIHNAAADYSVGDRLGSVLTAVDGSFSLTYEDSEFRVQNMTEKRPDLYLMIFAPEDSDNDGVPKILYSSIIRQNAGRFESYLIKIKEAVLTEAGIPVPNSQEKKADDKIQHYRAAQNTIFKVNDGIAEFHKEVMDVHIEGKKEFRKKIIDTFTPVPVAVTGVYVKEGESIQQKEVEVAEKGIDTANEILKDSGSDDTKGVPVNLYLTPDDKEKLKEYFDNAENGFAVIPESDIRPILFRTTSSENFGTLLVNNNPIAKYCRERTFDETCAIDHLEENGEDHDHGGNGTAVTGVNVTKVTSADIPTYVAKMVSDMPSPDSVLQPGSIPTRPDEAAIENTLDSFSLRKGPAETPAYYDFHSLQIAFEHVWKQLFDEEIVNTSYTLQQGLKSKSGADFLASKFNSVADIRNFVATIFTTPLSDVPAEVAAQFEITREEWNELTNAFKNKLIELADKIDDLLNKQEVVKINVPFFPDIQVKVPNKLTIAEEKLRQYYIEQGERIIDSVRHDDYYTMHKTLRDLQDRINSRYEYTVFAADKDHCSVNFGILNTFRQEWIPLDYQVGRLCKTIPLAPKEERKYSLKITRNLKRSEKNARKNNTSFTNEQTQTSRVEGEIIAKALNKTNFNLTTEGTYNIGISKGTSNTSLGIEALNESQQTRKDFREAVLKATQEYKEERSIEINTEDSSTYEYNDSGTIVNPNDELAVTYLFYELQRRYRVSEQLYRIMPVVLVAQEVPQPNEITEAWVVANDWILNHFLLDDSFKPALDYLAKKSVGDDFAIRELRRNLRQQRNLVETLKLELTLIRSESDNRYRALERAIKERIDEESGERTDGLFSDIGDFFGGGGQDPEAAKARELAAKDAHQYAVEKAEKMAAAVRQEIDTLHKLTSEYNKALRDHLDNEMCIKRFLVHIRNNIIYYMQAIWSMEPPDQRFLRLQKVQVPHLELDEEAANGGRTYKVALETSEDIFAPFRPEGTEKHKAFMTGKLKKPFTFKPLIEVADLDKPLGFKGNYMIFPLLKHNALTEFMAAPYIDSAFGAMDPDELSNLNLNEFSRFICCLHDYDKEKFDELKPLLIKWLGELLADPLRNGDELVIPSGSLYIEALPAAHPLLEDFKLRHRELDVLKAANETRKLGLESLRYAARILEKQYEDPDIEKKIVVEGSAVETDIDPSNN